MFLTKEQGFQWPHTKWSTQVEKTKIQGVIQIWGGGGGGGNSSMKKCDHDSDQVLIESSCGSV